MPSPRMDDRLQRLVYYATGQMPEERRESLLRLEVEGILKHLSKESAEDQAVILETIRSHGLADLIDQ